MLPLTLTLSRWERGSWLQGRILERGVLAEHRLGGRGGEALGALPLLARPHLALAADLVEAPVDLEPVAIGIAELHGNLHAGATPAVEIDLYLVFAQMVARADHLVERRDLEGNVVELDVGRLPRHRADQRDTVMIRIEAHEHHAARHHVGAVDVGDLEPEHLGVEAHRAVEVADVEHDMAELADAERHALRPSQGAQRVGMVGHGRLSIVNSVKPALTPPAAPFAANSTRRAATAP